MQGIRTIGRYGATPLVLIKNNSPAVYFAILYRRNKTGSTPALYDRHHRQKRVVLDILKNWVFCSVHACLRPLQGRWNTRKREIGVVSSWSTRISIPGGKGLGVSTPKIAYY